jgi:hypothetical protein
MAYATLEQFRAYLGLESDEDTPEDAEQALRTAGEMVKFWTRGARFELVSPGVPKDPGVKSALERATCEQASYLVESGDVSGYAAAFANLALGNFSIAGNRGKQGESEDPLASMASPVATLILINAGLLSSFVGSAW